MPSRSRSRSHPAAAQPWLNTAALVALVLLLLWAPVPLGSNRPWAVAALALMLWGVLLALWLLGLGLGSTPQRSALGQRLAAAAPLWGLALALAAWAALPLLPVPETGWAAVFHTQDAWATRQFVLKALCYAGAMLLTVLAVAHRGQLLWVLGALVAAGLLQACVSVVAYAGSGRYLLWFHEFNVGSRPSGTFVNPDHLAGFLELSLAAGIGLMLALLGPSSGRAMPWRERLAALAAFVMSPKVLVRLSLVPLVVALVLTRSRMGNGVFFGSLLVVGALLAWRSRQWRRPALWLVGSMLVVDLVVLGQWVGLDAVVKRMQGTAEASSSTIASFGISGQVPPPSEESLQQRLYAPLAALPLVAQKPVAGWGGGGFALAFSPQKPEHVHHLWWDNAHNDYVQVAVDVGLVGLALWASMGLCALWRLWPLLADKHPAVDRGVAVAALMALLCLGLHSLVDFNLQIPANALAFSVLLALVAMVPALPPQPATAAKKRTSGA